MRSTRGLERGKDDESLLEELGGLLAGESLAGEARSTSKTTTLVKEAADRIRELERQNRELAQALDSANEKYRRLKANIPGLVYVFELRPDGRTSFPYVSKNCKEMFGIRAEEVMRDGNLLMTLLLPEDLSRLNEAIQESATTLRPFRFEGRFTREGEIRWCECISRPERQSDGNILWDGIVLDITERKRAEEALRASEAKYRQLHTSMMDAFARADVNGMIVEANQAFCDLVGYTEDELRQMSYLDITPERWKESDFKIKAEQTWVRGYSEVYEKEYLRKDGTLVPVELRVLLVRDTNGLPTGMWAIVRDISDRKKAEHRLLLTQACFDNAAIGIHRVGKDLRIQEVNEYFCTCLGYTREEVLRLKISDIDQSVNDEWLLRQGEALRESGVHTFESVHRRKDGSTFPVQVTVSRIVHEGQRFVYAFSLDISERKRAEESLLQSEAKYRQLHETMFDAYARGDMAGNLIDANEAFCELVGYSLDELKTLTYVDLTLEHWRPYEAEILASQLLVRDHTDVYEKEYVRKDGSVVPVELRVFLMRDAHGDPASMWAIVRDITERKRVEKALRLTQFCFEKAAIGICRVERDRRFIEVNEEFCRMLGYSRDELLSMSISDVCEEVTAEWMTTHRNALSHTGVRRFEVMFTRKDGTRFPVAVTTCRIVYEGKEYVFSFNVDITDRKRSERDLTLRRDCLDISPNGFAILDKDVRFVYANKAYLRMWGHDSQEAILGTLPDSHCEDPSFPLQVVEALHAHGECSMEYVAKRRDGTTFHASLAARLSVDGEGETVYVVSVIDISERKRSEDALKLSEERLRLALTAAKLAVYDLNLKTGSGLTSPEFGESLGYSPDEFEIDINTWATWLHPDDADHALEIYTACQRGELPEYDLEYRLRTKTGDWKWFRSQGRVIAWDVDGMPLRCIGTHADITALKAAEEEHARLELQLNHARKMESIGRLAGGVAHDFNNMLTVILGYSELIKDELDPGSHLLSYMMEVEKAAVRSRDVTSQLLAFSRKQFIVPTSIDLNASIVLAEKSLLRLIGEDVALQLHLADSLWKIKFDASQIDQILVNLSVNARDAMPNGGTLMIETANIHCDEEYCRKHMDVTPGKYVLMQVSDDGSGMDDDTMSHLFEPFFTTKEVGKGTGLGLATIYGILKQNGGFVNVYSEVGRGTTFKIHFPSLAGEFDDSSLIEEPPSPTGTASVLLVEDDSMVRGMTESMLKSLGYTVVSCTTPEEAKAWCEVPGNRVDLLITDVVMPGMNGRQLRDEIVPICPDIKVLYMSGYTANIVLHHGVIDSDVNFLQKPFSKSNLANKVYDALLRD
ncbi:MAG: PAS domain S-box protein [Candidatus Hydrogenedentes bacterium]|nr:PAS domain S-box protein [Candidatus Hydrogenedentota bacterium]